MSLRLLLLPVAMVAFLSCTRSNDGNTYRDTRDPDAVADDTASSDDGQGKDPGPGDDGVTPDVVDDPGADPGTPPDTATADTSTPAPVELLAEASLDDKTSLKGLLKVIDEATTSIDLAHFEANSDHGSVKAVLNELIQAHARGVTVRAMFDDADDLLAENQAAVDYLTAQGVTARLDGASRTLHVKMVVVDRKTVLFGSTNLSETSLKYSHEANLLVRDALVGQKAAEYFQELWDEPGSSKDLPRAQTAHVTVAFDRDTADLLRERIRAASDRVLLVYYDISLASDEVRTAMDELVAAKNRGCQVSVILEKNDWSGTPNDINAETAAWLKGKGVQVLADPIAEQTHAKLAIVDDQVVVSSGNLSYTSLYQDHEMAGVTADPAVLAEALDFFQALKAVSAVY